LGGLDSDSGKFSYRAVIEEFSDLVSEVSSGPWPDMERFRLYSSSA